RAKSRRSAVPGPLFCAKWGARPLQIVVFELVADGEDGDSRPFHTIERQITRISESDDQFADTSVFGGSDPSSKGIVFQSCYCVLNGGKCFASRSGITLGKKRR